MSDLTISASAATRLCALREKEGRHLRLEISAGGCSGFQRRFFLDDPREDDLRFGPKGSELLVDSVSLDLIRGSTVDYHSGLDGAYFDLKTPQAKSGCGCGASFAL